VLADLDGDGIDEVILIYGDDPDWWGTVLKVDAHGNWTAAATLPAPHCKGDLQALQSGNFKVFTPPQAWRSILVGNRVLPVKPPDTDPPPTCPS
jgi:hypothetical protein